MINAKSHPLTTTIDSFMKEFMNEFPSAVNKTVREDVLHYPPVNIINKYKSYVLEMLVPGYSKQDFKVKLDNKVLSISAEHKENTLEESDKMLRKEFSLKAFKRSFNLDEKIDKENISAQYTDGILTLNLPKHEPSQPEAKDIIVL